MMPCVGGICVNVVATRELLTVPVGQLAEESRRRPFDAVIVGGGSAAISAALALAGRDQRVAMLEAGPLSLLTHVQSTDVRFQPNGPAQLRAGLEYAPENATSGEPFGMLVGCLGGRGLFWNGACPRMLPHELADWPLRPAELEPHYAWVEQRFRASTRYGESGLLRVLRARMRQEGLPLEALPFAVDTTQTAGGWLGGSVGNAMSMLLRGAVVAGDERNPHIAVRAFVSRVLLSGDTVRGVVALDRDSATEPGHQVAHEVLGDRVLLAAGALESVRLAKVSDVPDHSGLLGCGVLDHLYARSYVPIPTEWYDPTNREVALGYLPSTEERPYQIEVHAPTAQLFSAREDASWRPAPTNDYRALVRGFAPVESNPDNRVEPLAEDRPGSYRVHFEYTDQDLKLREQMVETMRSVQQVLGDDPEPEVRPPGASYHEAGGLGMGEQPGTSVTDPAGRFWACPSLVACDASAWPTIGAANVHLSIAALSRRNALLAVTR